MFFFASDCEGSTGEDVLDDEIGIGVDISGTGIAEYSDVQKISGATSIFFDPTTAFKIATYTFSAAPDEAYVRMYLFISSSNPSGNTVFAKFRNSSTNVVVGQLSFTTAGKIRVARAVTTAWASVNTYIGEWVRVEWRVNGGVDQELRIFSGANLHGTIPNEASGVVAADVEPVMSDFAFGGIAVSAGSGFYIDDVSIADSAEGWIGPIIPTPTADFLVTPAAPEVFEVVTFEDRSVGTIDEWSWDFGDGTGSVEQNPTHAYTAEGNYSVRLTVANRDGSDTTSLDIAVSAVDVTVLYASSFENGADGALVTALDEGLDSVNGELRYSTVRKVDGDKSIRIEGISSAWAQVDVGSEPQVAFRGYFYFEEFVATRQIGLVVFRASGSAVAGLFLDKYGGIQLRTNSNVGSLLVRSKEKLESGIWHRIEVRIKPDQLVARIWPGATRHSIGDPVYRVAYTPPTDAQFPNIEQVRFGATNPVEGGIYHIDAVSVELDWAGPLDGAPDLVGAAFRAQYVGNTDNAIQFTDFSSGVITGWDWDFKDGTHSAEQNPTHQFSAPGTYDVELTVTDGAVSRRYSREVTIIEVADVQPPLNVRVSGVWEDGAIIRTEDGSIGRARVYVGAEDRWTGNTLASPPTDRQTFPGDPGPNKIYMGTFPEGTNMSRFDFEMHPNTGLVSDVTLPSPYNGLNSVPLNTSAFRNFEQWGSVSNGMMDNIISRGMVPWTSWKLSSGTQTRDIANGVYDTFIRNIAAYFNSRPNRFFFWTLNHEPERSTWMEGHPRAVFGDYNTSPNRQVRMNYRRAQRRMYRIFREEGVTNATHAPVLWTQFAFSNTVRDPWWEWWPDWKGDETFPTDPALDDRDGIVSGDGLRPGYQGTYYVPDPDDFWVSGNNRTCDIVGYDLYCFHCKGGNTAVNPADNMWKWTDTVLYYHTIIEGDNLNPNQNPAWHARTFHQIFDQIYGPGLCYGIGEYGYGFKEREDPGNPGHPQTFLNDSLDYYDFMYDEFLANNIVIVVHWRGMMSNRNTRHWNSMDNTIATIFEDPNDVRRKIHALHMKRPETVHPAGFPVWGA